MADYRIPKIDNGWTKLRKENHTSVQDIADTIGICSRSQLNDIFRGKRIAYDDELKMLCMYFKIPFEEGQKINEEAYRKANEGLNPSFTRRNNEEPYMKFKTPLNELRIENKRTLKDIAEYCGVTDSYMSMIFNGRMQCKPAIKEKLKELFDLGYAQISDLCNRTYNYHPNGDLRKRSSIHLDEKPSDILEENNEVVCDPYAPTPEDFKEYEDSNGTMPDIDYSKPISAPENAAYRKWAKKKGIIIDEKDTGDDIHKPETGKWTIEYGDGEIRTNIEPKPLNESATRSRNHTKQVLIDSILDAAYGKVTRKDFVDLERVLNQYWMV